MTVVKTFKQLQERENLEEVLNTGISVLQRRSHHNKVRNKCVLINVTGWPDIKIDELIERHSNEGL